MVRTFVGELAKTAGDGIAELESCVGREAHGCRMLGARLGTPPPKSRSGGRLPLR
jgi:hypothetical protein